MVSPSRESCSAQPARTKKSELKARPASEAMNVKETGVETRYRALLRNRKPHT